MTPPPLARPLPPPPAMRRPTLVGVPRRRQLPAPMGVGGLPPLAAAARAATRTRTCDVRAEPARGQRSAGAAAAPAPAGSPADAPAAAAAVPHGARAGAVRLGKLRRHGLQAPARRGVAVLGAVAVVAIVGMVYWYNSAIKPGRHRAGHDARRRDRPGRQRQGRRPFAGVDREVARALHAVGHARRLCAQRPEHRAAGRAAAGARRHAGALARHRLRAHQRSAGRPGLARRRAGQGALRAAGPHGLPRVAHRPGAPRARNQGREPLQALAAGRGDRARARSARFTRRSFPPSARAGGRGKPAPSAPRRAAPAGGEKGRRRRRRRLRRSSTQPPTPPPARQAAARRADAAARGRRLTRSRPGRRRAPPARVPAKRRRRARRRAPRTARGRAGRRPRRAGRRSPPPIEPGGGDCSITVNSIPWSEVWIDGKNTTKHTPFVDYKIPCGKHKLAFKRPDMQIDQTESINVSPGRTSSSATRWPPTTNRTHRG